MVFFLAVFVLKKNCHAPPIFSSHWKTTAMGLGHVPTSTKCSFTGIHCLGLPGLPPPRIAIHANLVHIIVVSGPAAQCTFAIVSGPAAQMARIAV